MSNTKELQQNIAENMHHQFRLFSTSPANWYGFAEQVLKICKESGLMFVSSKDVKKGEITHAESPMFSCEEIDV